MVTAGVVAAVAPSLASLFGGASTTVAALMSLGLILIASAPLCFLLNRDAERIAQSALSTSDAATLCPAKTSPILAAVAASVHSAVEQLAQSNEDAQSRVREMDINSRVSSSERDRLEIAMQSMQDAVVITNQFGELVLVNPVAAQLLGVILPDDLNRALHTVVKNESVRRLLEDAHNSGSATHRKRVEISISSGGEEGNNLCEREYEATVACLQDAKDRVGGAVLILRDISREREISQMKSEFVSKASHELRTPLSSINAYIEMLLDGEADDKESRAEFYTVIKTEAERLGRLIDNMLNISRIEAGIVKAQYTDVDFVKAAQTAIDVIIPQAQLKEMSVNLKSGPLLYSAEVDQDMLHQVMLNLLSNAVKYTPEGGRVTVTVENDETTSSVMVSVADTGLGIPPDAIDRVFEKFYRIENYKRVAKGTGLGLNLVRNIVEVVHQGHISVSSELGLGSRFVFTIPYTRQGAYEVAA